MPINADIYQKIIQRFGDEPLKGLIVHMAATQPDGTLRHIDVWESEELCAKAFDERIHPAVHATFAELGLTGVSEPTVNRLHLVDLRGTAVPAPDADADA
ncbi:hypothetical protein [Nonomuraea turcica]|uniref:hypothetical protein n=1 Tax=Nonomuraea sp. G32 TaxID=3067274 RepID=UPI00273B8A30|nr:hypothetical protein [Nonomuraea sp. G32]MDP4501308.1 hypothetical protein [Nonomuraea sp. G32]